MKKKTFACRAFALLTPALLITGCGGESVDQALLEEQQANKTPVVVIDGVGKVITQSDFVLDGSASRDTDGMIANWSWSQVDTGAPSATISGETTQSASITAPYTDVPVDLVFRLTLTDDKGASASTDFTVTVKPMFTTTPCSVDDVSALPDSGVYSTGQVSDLIALCDSEVLLGNTSNNRIEYVDLATGTVMLHYELTAEPDDLDYDPGTGLVYASMKNATSVARVNLVSGLVDYIAVSAEPSGIAARHGNGVYIISPDVPSSLVYWYDANDVEHGPHAVTGDMIQFNQTLGQVITAPRGLSPTTVYVYGFDVDGNIVLVESRGSLGGNGQTLKISPDDEHLVLVAGGGNGAGYTITDLYPSDLTSSFGAFDTGAYPTGADFPADSSRFATANHEDFLVYQVSNHAELFRATPATTDCGYADLTASHISRGGQVGISLQRCGFDDDTTNLHWYKLP